MKATARSIVAMLALCMGGAAWSQKSLVDVAASQVIARYERSTCEQLYANKARPKSPEQQKMVQLLRNNPAARTAFLNKVAGPIANKQFECGLLP